MLSILVLSTKKQYSSFLKCVSVFQKIYVKVKVLKSFKISMEVCFKNPYFKRTYALSVGFKMKSLYTKKCFPVLRQKPIFAISLVEMLKEATIHFLLIDESHFSSICTL